MKIYYPDIYHCFIQSEVRWIKFCFEIDLKEFMKTQARILMLLETLLSAYIYNIRTLSVNIKFICTSFRIASLWRAFQACFAASTNEFYI